MEKIERVVTGGGILYTLKEIPKFLAFQIFDPLSVFTVASLVGHAVKPNSEYGKQGEITKFFEVILMIPFILNEVN